MEPNVVFVSNTSPTLGFYVGTIKYKFVAGRFDTIERISDPDQRKEAEAVLTRISASPFNDGVVKEADYGKVPAKPPRQKTQAQIERETATIEPIDGRG